MRSACWRRSSIRPPRVRFWPWVRWMLPARPCSLAAFFFYVGDSGFICRSGLGIWLPLRMLLGARRGSASGLSLWASARWAFVIFGSWVTLSAFPFPRPRGLRARALLGPPWRLAPCARGGVWRLGGGGAAFLFDTLLLLGFTTTGSAGGARRSRRARFRFAGLPCPRCGIAFLAGRLCRWRGPGRGPGGRKIGAAICDGVPRALGARAEV